MAAQGEFVKPHPLLTRFLRSLLPVHTRDSITGDLLEEFGERAQQSPRSAQQWYMRQVCSFVAVAPWFGCCVRASLTGLAAYAAACAAVLSTPVFAPGIAVAVVLLALPGIAFWVAYRTENFRAGLGASLATGVVMMGASVTLILTLGLRHPPKSATLLPMMVCSAVAAVSALAGKSARERMETPRLVP
jgi:ABC-type uncharacterized transport system permease subunit